MDSLDILKGATLRGWRTSEFWLSVVALGVMQAVPPLSAVACGIVAAAYAIARALVKMATARALLEPVEPPVRVGSR